MIHEITSDESLDQAYAWVCQRRRDYSHNQDVWSLRCRWKDIKPQLQADLLAGRYRLGPVHRFQGNGESTEVWGALDALVLKAIAIVLSQRLELPGSCYHLAGGQGGTGRGSEAAGGGPTEETCQTYGKGPNEFRATTKQKEVHTDCLPPAGSLSLPPRIRWENPSERSRPGGKCLVEPRGAKAAVRDVVDHLPGNPFVFRTDVTSYYASIDHDVLMAKLRERVDDVRVLDLLEQYVRRTVYCDGVYEDVARGISLGCPLSPLMGALYLAGLDERMEDTGLFYARFMDDWVVLAPTRWKLRKAIKIVRETLAELKVMMHPGKTFIGRVARGFSFLGYQIGPSGIVGAAVQTLERFRERVTRLYEQGAPAERIGKYVRRWRQWLRAGLQGYAPVTLGHADVSVSMPLPLQGP